MKVLLNWSNTVLIIEQIDKVVCKGHRNLLFWSEHLRHKSFGLHVLSSNLFTNTIGRVCVCEREKGRRKRSVKVFRFSNGF